MKMSSLQAQGEAFEEARWVTYGADFEVLIRPIGNVDYDAELARAMRITGRGKDRTMKTDPATINAAVKVAMSKTVLVGWKGLEDDNGTPIPYTSEKALELFNANHKFFSDIRDIAQEARTEVTEEETDAEGN